MQIRPEQAKIPEHVLTYQRVREAILFGELVPGQAVTIQGLVDRLGAGMMPVREAIRRLTAEGALKSLGNRRIVVPRLTEAQVEELAFARLAIEPELAARAARRADADFVTRLAGIDADLDAAIATGSVEGYLRHNYRFHFSLYQGANAPILTEMADVLWLRSGPSLRVVCGLFGTSNLPDFHDEALAALRQGDATLVRDAIAHDIEQGMQQVRASLEMAGAEQAD